ncbi:MAG TPA: 50S ribosomal protein L24 [candidate division Zixibacteria bacterium]|nr:50S ribosomal protein L24 [candidate division Zixibacteria bacterium]
MQPIRPLTKPTKQRKMLYQAPDHVRHRLLAAHLSPSLRATHITKSFPVRSGDTVRLMRGDHKGFEGKITRIDLKKYRIYVEGLTREKVDGTTIFVPVHPSKLMITHLILDDKWRKKILDRKQKPQKKQQKPTKKLKPEPAQKPPETAELEQPLEEKVAEEKVVEEKVAEVKVTAAVKRPSKKRVSKRKKKAKKAAAEKKEAQGAETKAKKEPKIQRKRTKRGSTKKTEEGEE